MGNSLRVQYQAQIEVYRKNKQDALDRLATLQESANQIAQIAVDVHQLDGAIGVLTGLLLQGEKAPARKAKRR